MSAAFKSLLMSSEQSHLLARECDNLVFILGKCWGSEAEDWRAEFRNRSCTGGILFKCLRVPMGGGGVRIDRDIHPYIQAHTQLDIDKYDKINKYT